VLDGREARGDDERKMLLYCGSCISFEPHKHYANTRQKRLQEIKANGFPCNGQRGPHERKGYCDLATYVGGMLAAKFVWSPKGNGWSNFRDWEVGTTLVMMFEGPHTHTRTHARTLRRAHVVGLRGGGGAGGRLSRFLR
jgi:hypothetical protein